MQANLDVAPLKVSVALGVSRPLAYAFLHFHVSDPWGNRPGTKGRQNTLAIDRKNLPFTSSIMKPVRLR